MISHEHKCIFIHIPKCAGTSVERALGHLDNHTGRWGQDHRTMAEIEGSITMPWAQPFKIHSEKILNLLHLRRMPKSNQKNRLVVTRGQYENYFKFTFVRNPWARAYSWYQNIMRDKMKKKKLNISGNPSFTDFLRSQVGKDALRSQTHWLKCADGTIKMDFIGKFENLNRDFQQACKMMGLHHIELPHEIKGAGESYLKFYDKESADLIANAYKEEIEMFGYSFEGN